MMTDHYPEATRKGPGIRLIAGLGNPGPFYADTRHNIGFMVAEALAAAKNIVFAPTGEGTMVGRGRIGEKSVVLAKPQDYMNRSGPPLLEIAHAFCLTCEEMIVIHDDLDLAFGRLKIKEKGGDGGHKGVRSIMDAFQSDGFTRLRVGIGRPGAGIPVVDHVLEGFNADEKKILDQVVDRARDAVETVLGKGIRTGMDRFNVRGTEFSS